MLPFCERRKRDGTTKHEHTLATLQLTKRCYKKLVHYISHTPSTIEDTQSNKIEMFMLESYINMHLQFGMIKNALPA